MSRKKLLSVSFQPSSYLLKPTEETGQFALEIKGRKLGTPSRRITLAQTGLRVIGAQLTALTKKGSIEIPLTRINHLKSFEQVRLHTAETLFPGDYKLKLEFKGRLSTDDYKKLQQQTPNELDKLPLRHYFPCIDEPEAKRQAVYVFEL